MTLYMIIGYILKIKQNQVNGKLTMWRKKGKKDKKKNNAEKNDIKDEATDNDYLYEDYLYV